jgi:hypothetical protein
MSDGGDEIIHRKKFYVRIHFKPEATPPTDDPRGFRRLKWDELVRRGDFVMDEHQGFDPWEGPSGFRADAFLKPIYRRRKHRSEESTKAP